MKIQTEVQPLPGRRRSSNCSKVGDPITHQMVEQPKARTYPDSILSEGTIAAARSTLVDVSDVLGMDKFQTGTPDTPRPRDSFADQIERQQWFAAEVLRDPPPIAASVP